MPQNWSKARACHPVAADGIAYHGRHDDTEQCFALLERAVFAMSPVERRIDLDANGLWQVADVYKVELAPDRTLYAARRRSPSKTG
ncbi:hypothetical protein [Rhizobium sullae]|uniref:hypothetical protein n=1 Tax=Rhizobium sullae TaxID=50338 RepID=UPI000B36492B|nr:hypothetical protein [Rhizobium sullae]